ncbi:Hypothetical predicted protein [Lecanosticta acicola]|uniref:Uncharacterized protein n=1 Tax=Lecanosticta acicola TaxID=111012 RepID=A0AAI8VVP8_9PEZI|nr:Hypothetical predicted protein [Lecanosticta acicola]
MTRREHLRRQYEEQKGELDRAHAVLGYLQGGSDSEAAECLARLRIGCTVDQVYHMLGSRSPGLDGRQMSPEAAHVAAQLSSSHLSTALTGGPSTISTDGGDFDGAALPVGAGPPRDTTGPSMYASPRSWDEALLTSASTEYPTSPWSDILDLALQQ